jgi:hypothetical protein
MTDDVEAHELLAQMKAELAARRAKEERERARRNAYMKMYMAEWRKRARAAKKADGEG